MNLAESEQGGNHMGQLVGEGLDHLDVLFQEAVHQWEHNGSHCKPQIPRVIAPLMVAPPMGKVVVMAHQRRPALRQEKHREER